MVRMDVRELKDNLSSALRQAAAGQVIEVTEHGHPLARIVPIHRHSRYGPLAPYFAHGGE
jgi:prevent-host-death family protein